MKTIPVIILSLFLSFGISAQNPLNRLGTNDTLHFNDTDFNLSWTDKPNENYYIQEYLPKGETTNGYNQMMTIHLFVTNINAKDAVAQKVKELKERKKHDAVCNYQVTESPDGKEFIVDFLLGESKDKLMTIVEFNAYHYKEIQLSESKKAIVIYAYTKRSYGDGITDFLKSLKEDRSHVLNEMISTKIPGVAMRNI